jgi:uncharacterized membrane protein SpoIIM required for sporulation
MNVAKVLEKRQQQWVELEQLCDKLEVSAKDKQGGAAGISRFATLYRAACADLALSDAYQLPPATVTYLHRLVARAHNRLYRASRINPATWADTVLRTAPQQIFIDPCVRVATFLFFGLFTLSAIFGVNETWFPDFVQQLVGQEQIEAIETMYEQPINGSLDHYVRAAGFYIMHNTGIGLQCFAFGILIIPCLFKLAYNAVTLGAIFGYMAREDSSGGDNFLHFVTAHGPFELTAIALAGAAGLRFGIGLFHTQGLTRVASLRNAATRAVPIMAASATLFFLAAFTEGFISPSPLPYLFKAFWAIFSAGLVSFYFVVLGFPRDLGEAKAGVLESPWDPLSDERGGATNAA